MTDRNSRSPATKDTNEHRFSLAGDALVDSVYLASPRLWIVRKGPPDYSKSSAPLMLSLTLLSRLLSIPLYFTAEIAYFGSGKSLAPLMLSLALRLMRLMRDPPERTEA